MTLAIPPLQYHDFAQASVLDQALASLVAAQLDQALRAQGRASLAVSGGKTPIGFFQALSRQALEWSSIHIILVDERWVATDHADSNTQLVQQHLLTGAAAAAQFYPYYNGARSAHEAASTLNQLLSQFPWPLNVAVLGMGEDGHTASLFPHAPELADALNSNAHCIAITPVSAAHTRISLTLSALSEAQCLITHIVGATKRQVLDNALRCAEPPFLPIRRVLDAAKGSRHIFWASEA